MVAPSTLAKPRSNGTGPALRRGRPEDAEACGRICHQAFDAIAAEHHFTPDFPSADAAIGLLAQLLSHPGFYSVVAERDGEIVGSNFLDERSTISGVGPVTVRPGAQNSSIGRSLMADVMARAAQRGTAGVRLLQSAYHNRSLALYASLGFEVREPIACLQGEPFDAAIPDAHVRRATAVDLEPCNRLCERVHGHHRAGELQDCVEQGTAMVVERGDRISGYVTAMAFFGHAIGERTDDVKALIAASPTFGGPGILVPSRNTELFRWCLDQRLRVVQTMTLMTVGTYREPTGAYLPSVLY